MKPNPKPVERLFPFTLRAKLLVVGREALRRSRKRLQFVLVTRDLSGNSLQEICRDFADVPVVQRFNSGDLETFFRLKATKVIGFRKSALARSLFSELKGDCILAPKSSPQTPVAPAMEGPNSPPPVGRRQPAVRHRPRRFKAPPRRSSSGPRPRRTKDAVG